ncbi:Cytochrome P450 94A2 [Camellia lanceoleosa]|uniref:Cytochrome P450 94A2 n=1 Tax=Camellia lanceoleosa TaxID=1840588 RepID=A0ACC0FVV1_9ERIC|nr:Cytochrome P450 94A2 [Camellia lanceoleosa]
MARDPYTYLVFQAGPRICLGKEMAFLQMKRVVSGVMRQFRVVPAFEEGEEPILIAHLVSKMKGGFPVKIGGLRRISDAGDVAVVVVATV